MSKLMDFKQEVNKVAQIDMSMCDFIDEMDKIRSACGFLDLIEDMLLGISKDHRGYSKEYQKLIMLKEASADTRMMLQSVRDNLCLSINSVAKAS